MNGDEYTGLKTELVRIAEEIKGLKEILSVKFEPLDKHLDESPKFRDKVIKNCTSIFWLRVIFFTLFPLIIGLTIRILLK